MENYLWVFGAIIALVTLVNFILSLSDRTEAKGKWRGSVDARLESLEKAVGEIADFLKSLFPTPLSIKSPINLNELGKEISDGLGAAKWAKSLALSLTRQENPELKNLSHYGIQKYCFDIVEERADRTEIGKKVEEWAYKKGLKKRQVLDVLAVELRDAIFDELKMDKNVDY